MGCWRNCASERWRPEEPLPKRQQTGGGGGGGGGENLLPPQPPTLLTLSLPGTTAAAFEAAQRTESTGSAAKAGRARRAERAAARPAHMCDSVSRVHAQPPIVRWRAHHHLAELWPGRQSGAAVSGK